MGQRRPRDDDDGDDHAEAGWMGYSFVDREKYESFAVLHRAEA